MAIHHSPSLQNSQDPNPTSPITAVHLNPPPEASPPSDLPPEPQINRPKLTRRKKSSSSSSAIHNYYHNQTPLQRGIRIPNKRRNPRFSVRRSATDVEDIAFPLGMSIAAVLAQILERKDLTTENTPVDHLSMICASAVRESLTNKSFGSTLSTLRLIRNSSIHNGGDQVRDNIVGDCSPRATPALSFRGGECSLRSYNISDDCTESVNSTFGARQHLKIVEEIEHNQLKNSRNLELSLQGHMSNQLAVSNMGSHFNNHSMLSTIEKSVVEQTRANDLKSVEIGLIMKKLQLKETQLALESDSNFLERCKLSVGISRSSFKAEKFKCQLEETRHSELLKTCADFLVADLLIMSGCLNYGVYAFSYDKLHQLTKSCSPSEESKSWWIPRPMASFNSGLKTLNCQVQVYSRMLFGVLMILAIAYVLVQRLSISRQAMPITFIVLLLGVGCGLAGKLCVDTLGGNGYHWLIFWELLCILHFFANVFTPFLFHILNGPVQVSQGKKPCSKFPFWIRRWLFYLILFLVPVCCGLLPFARPRTWWEEHFSNLIRNHLLATYAENYDDASSFHE